MIVVKVELWPAGNAWSAHELARAKIWNDETGDLITGNYQVQIDEDGTPVSTATVKNHKRDQSVWRLVKKALAQI